MLTSRTVEDDSVSPQTYVHGQGDSQDVSYRPECPITWLSWLSRPQSRWLHAE
jgi:hypothetical protein